MSKDLTFFAYHSTAPRSQLSTVRRPAIGKYYEALQAAILAATPGSTRLIHEVAQNCQIDFHTGGTLERGGGMAELKRSRELCELIEQKEVEFRRALDNSGLPPRTVELFISFVDFRLDTQQAMHEIEINRLLQSLKGRDTAEMGSVDELAAALEVSTETVRRRTVKRTLIAVLGPGRKRGREYPMFQAWPGIAGAPLEAVLAALQNPDGATAYQFMTTPSDALGGLTPIEVMLGEAPQEADLAPGAREFLQEGDEVRLRAVVETAAARALAAEAA